MGEGGEGRGEGQKEERRDERGEGERRQKRGKGTSEEGGREGKGDKRRVGGHGRREVGKEECGKGHGVHPRCFRIWPSPNSGSPALLPTLVSDMPYVLNRYCVPLHYQS